MTTRPKRLRRWLILPPIALGMLVLILMVRGREPPAAAPDGEAARPVRVVVATQRDVRPAAVGYGPVEPARVWAAVAQVAGRVVSIHPRLRDGEMLEAGALLVQIDPVDYELAIAEVEAELATLDVEERNANVSLEIAARNLALAEKDLERKRQLVKQGTTPQSTADEAERAMLASRVEVQQLRNTLALVPARRDQLRARAARARRDLERTEIRAPFDLRVANRQVEADQYVRVGEALFDGDAVHRVEIEAQVAMSSLRRLFLGHAELDRPVDPTRLGELVAERIGLNPLVRLDLGDTIAEWSAEFVRFSDTVDPDTRTMGVVVAVDRPFDKMVPGQRPPLWKGMFVEVALRGRNQTDRILVPRSAVRDGAVYVADADDRLRRRTIDVLFQQDDYTVVANGIEPGERVVVSDVIPAVEGMRLRPQIDAVLSARLAGGDDA